MSSDKVLPVFHKLVYKELIEQEKVPTCITCVHLRGMICEKFSAYPPAETIVYGCEGWEVDMPF